MVSKNREYIFKNILLFIIISCFFCYFCKTNTELTKNNILLNKTNEQLKNSLEFYEAEAYYNSEDNKILKEKIEKLNKQNYDLEKNIDLLLIENNELNIELQNYKTLKENEMDLDLLYRIAVSEAGYSSAAAQKNVIYVILNRVNSDKFPNTISEVLNQPGQFGGMRGISVVKPTEESRKAVDEAFLDYEKNISAQGALYFGKGHTGGRTYLFTDEVGHQFWK